MRANAPQFPGGGGMGAAGIDWCIICDRFYSYLTNNTLITSHQSGLRSLHSTVTALLEATDLTDNWAYNIDQIDTVVFLDLKEALDTVDHAILLSKLKEYGVRSVSLEFFKSYLDCHNQKCFVNGSY